MSDLTYYLLMSGEDKPLVWLRGEVKTPPLSAQARLEAGFLLRQLQAGQPLGMPHSRPMPTIGPRCHELRIKDGNRDWRIVYRIDDDAVVIADVFEKRSQKTPKRVIDGVKTRLKKYDEDIGE